MSPAPGASACAPADVEAWLGELGLAPTERADRESITSWDLVLDGRRRARLRITLILDPSLALICWAHYAPPINDSFRVSYRKLLRWNDELPFVKFSIGEDERPLLVAEIPVAHASAGRAGARARPPPGGRGPVPRGHRRVAQGRRLVHRAVVPGPGRWPRRPPGRPLRAGAGRAAGPGRGRPRDRPDASGRPMTALAIALVLAVMAPVAGLVAPAAVSAADPGLTVVTDATYTVRPEDGNVGVSVAMTARNRTSETRTRRFFFDHTFLAVQPGATNLRISGPKGARVKVARRTEDSTLLRIDFGSRLYSGKAATMKLGFDLPGQGAGASPQVRVGSSLVTLPVWAFASNGARGSSVAVRFPPGWDVAVESGELPRRETTADGGTVLEAGPLAAPLDFFAFVSAQRPAVYVDRPLTRPGRRARRWICSSRHGRTTRRGRTGPARCSRMRCPSLREDIGLPWPAEDPLVIHETAGRDAGASAAVFDPAQNRMDVAYWADRRRADPPGGARLVQRRPAGGPLGQRGLRDVLCAARRQGARARPPTARR